MYADIYKKFFEQTKDNALTTANQLDVKYGDKAQDDSYCWTQLKDERQAIEFKDGKLTINWVNELGDFRIETVLDIRTQAQILEHLTKTSNKLRTILEGLS